MLPRLTIILLYSTIKLSSANFNCISRTSPVSNTGDDDTSFIGCDSAPYTTLVSCGCKPKNSADSNSDGCYVIDDKCYAQNGYSGKGMYAVARCCDLNNIPQFKCTSISGDRFVSGDGTAQAIQCGTSSHTFLTGCSVQSHWKSFDGCYPGTTNPQTHPPIPDTDYPFNHLNNFCTVENGGGGQYSGSKANAMCCDSPNDDLNCVIRYGSVTGSDKESYAICGDGYTITGCSGYGAFRSVNSWYISDDKCIARSYNTQPIYAIAICCKLETDAPTTDPTQSPTQRPTEYPTITPTVYPTDIPSASPTSEPTVEPTIEAASKKFGSNNDIYIDPWFWIIIVFVALFGLLSLLLYLKRMHKKEKGGDILMVNEEIGVGFDGKRGSMELYQAFQRNVVNYTK